jgi:hypothetical protein
MNGRLNYRPFIHRNVHRYPEAQATASRRLLYREEAGAKGPLECTPKVRHGIQGARGRYRVPEVSDIVDSRTGSLAEWFLDNGPAHGANGLGRPTNLR